MARCTLKDCPFGRDGRCVENQLPNCPNLVSEEPDLLADPKEADSLDRLPQSPVQFEALPSASKLSEKEAIEVLQNNPTQVVVFGGMAESGKSTLIARIFEMFQAGGIGEYRFRSSRTLAAFDKLSWHATMESGGSSATTEHTSHLENNLFLHLSVRPEKGDSPFADILISDIPGEVFPEAIAADSVCRNLCALQRADHLVLFLDSGALSDFAARHDHCGKVFDFATRALQTGQIGSHTHVHLVVSKWDLLGIDDGTDTLTFIANTLHAFEAKFGSRLAEVSTWRIAARPLHPVEPTLTEISQLFDAWLRVMQQDSDTEHSQRTGFKRDFCRFGTSMELS